GLPEVLTLNRVVDQQGRPRSMPAAGLMVSQVLADALGLSEGDDVSVEVLEGTRPIRAMPVSSIINDNMGLQAYIDVDELHRLMREGGTVSGAYLQVDDEALPALHAELKSLPAVAGVALTEASRRSFRETMAENL